MTKDDAVKALQDLSDEDQQTAHEKADKVLLAFLKANGHQDVADAYENLRDYLGGFWYA